MSRTAVITGASTGIGEACARRLANRGWQTVLVARRRDRIEAIAEQIGGRAVVADVTTITEDDLQDLDRCDLLINGAGGAIGLDRIDEADPADWTTMFESNVLGTLRLTQLLLPRLIAAQGCIVNITSTAALGGYEGGGGYCAAKGAARALTQSLRLEMSGQPLRITEVVPGLVHTPEFSLNRFGGDAERAESVYEGVDRPLSGDDVAAAVSMIADLPPHVNVDEIVLRPVAQRAQHSLFRGDLGWKHPRSEEQ